MSDVLQLLGIAVWALILWRFKGAVWRVLYGKPSNADKIMACVCLLAGNRLTITAQQLWAPQSGAAADVVYAYALIGGIVMLATGSTVLRRE